MKRPTGVPTDNTACAYHFESVTRPTGVPLDNTVCIPDTHGRNTIR